MAVNTLGHLIDMTSANKHEPELANELYEAAQHAASELASIARVDQSNTGVGARLAADAPTLPCKLPSCLRWQYRSLQD